MSTTSQLTTFIYGLCDPLTQQLRYVGKANRPDVRRYQHIESRALVHKSHKNHWIKSLQAKGSRPEMFVIEEVSKDGWQEAEQFWIAYFKSIGADLTNSTLGGEGDCGPEAHKKQADAIRGRKANRSPEHIAKLIVINKERAKDPEWRRKITIAAQARAQRERGTLMDRLKVAWFAPRTKRYDCVCIGCGSSFIATNTRKKYCKPQCCVNAWKRHDRATRHVEATR